jgi:hypothetical protein
MEHVLWEATLTHRSTDLDATADRLVEMLWAALQPPAPAVSALMRMKDDVAEAMRRYESAAKDAPAQNKRNGKKIDL